VIRKVLLADDDEATLIAVQATIGNDGTVEIRMARDGDEATEVARQWKPDLMFLDVNMPKQNGFEVCRNLKSDASTSSIKIVMLTGLSSNSSRVKALQEAGADDYLTKPFGAVQLFRKFEEWQSAGVRRVSS